MSDSKSVALADVPYRRNFQQLQVMALLAWEDEGEDAALDLYRTLLDASNAAQPAAEALAEAYHRYRVRVVKPHRDPGMDRRRQASVAWLRERGVIYE